RPEDEAEAAKLMAASWLKFVPFADAVRIALRMVAPFPITALELRGLLSRAGYPINQKTDPMVSLNVALTRLRDSEEVEIAEKEGRKAYRWAFRNELRPSSSAAQIDWEALVRTANQFGYTIAELDPEAADRALVGEAALTPAEEREIELYLRNSHATVPLTIDQLYRTFSMSHEIRSPRKIREFMKSFLASPASPFKEVKSKGKEPAFIQKRGS